MMGSVFFALPLALPGFRAPDARGVARRIRDQRVVDTGGWLRRNDLQSTDWPCGHEGGRSGFRLRDDPCGRFEFIDAGRKRVSDKRCGKAGVDECGGTTRCLLLFLGLVFQIRCG
jgi:hypothetical protein